MAGFTNKKYEFTGTANVGETIELSVNSVTPFSEVVPGWASGATIYFKVIFQS